jgi:hypothetical protein
MPPKRHRETPQPRLRYFLWCQGQHPQALSQESGAGSSERAPGEENSKSGDLKASKQTAGNIARFQDNPWQVVLFAQFFLNLFLDNDGFYSKTRSLMVRARKTP